MVVGGCTGRIARVPRIIPASQVRLSIITKVFSKAAVTPTSPFGGPEQSWTLLEYEYMNGTAGDLRCFAVRHAEESQLSLGSGCILVSLEMRRIFRPGCVCFIRHARKSR